MAQDSVRKSYGEMEGKQERNRVKNKVKQTRSSFHRLRLTSNEICVRLNKKKRDDRMVFIVMAVSKISLHILSTQRKRQNFANLRTRYSRLVPISVIAFLYDCLIRFWDCSDWPKMLPN
ncbi:hypothetical protein P5673_001535 [Acropora cervicornis]|uniref:Uncharacterized protein n=1 Tax=Acropora cervicornis TaxID=6130 RepID=A0AAD9R629_ACRCE|nr:hypothetical protein P5673_001535 [Acropora cervicornis]